MPGAASLLVLVLPDGVTHIREVTGVLVVHAIVLPRDVLIFRLAWVLRKDGRVHFSAYSLSSQAQLVYWGRGIFTGKQSSLSERYSI